MQGKRATEWVLTFEALREFMLLDGRWPVLVSKDGAGLENRLVRWVREQRRHQLRLDSWKVEMLESLPGFEWRPQQEAWDRHLEWFVRFVNTTGWSPRSTVSDPAERQLAAWVLRQRYLCRQGRLPKHRIDALTAVPGWRWF